VSKEKPLPYQGEIDWFMKVCKGYTTWEVVVAMNDIQPGHSFGGCTKGVMADIWGKAHWLPGCHGAGLLTHDDIQLGKKTYEDLGRALGKAHEDFLNRKAIRERIARETEERIKDRQKRIKDNPTVPGWKYRLVESALRKLLEYPLEGMVDKLDILSAREALTAGEKVGDALK
jgi:hypothetical protein